MHIFQNKMYTFLWHAHCLVADEMPVKLRWKGNENHYVILGWDMSEHLDGSAAGLQIVAAGD